MFSVNNLSYSVDDAILLEQISMEFDAGQMTALVGHNGSGKSTLLKHLARQIAPQCGEIRLGGVSSHAFTPREFARQVAYLPQDGGLTDMMTVREFVACGRYPWHGALGRVTAEDRQKVDEALTITNVVEFSGRAVSTLSGGERQRVRLAMLVAQNSRFLLLDEPTSALDIAHQVEVLSLIRRLCVEGGRGVAIVLHDINMAAQFCDHIVALKKGRIIAQGAPADLMTTETLAEIYGIQLDLLQRPGSDLPLVYVGAGAGR